MDERKPDIEVGALGAGCLTSCLTSLIAGGVLMGLLAASGVQIARVTPNAIPAEVRGLGFLLGLAAEVLVGFVTARKATQAKNLHVIILGALFMLVGVLAFVLPARSGRELDPLMLIHWLLTIPLMLLGASWARER